MNFDFKWGAITNMAKYTRIGKGRRRSGKNKMRQINGGTMRTIADMKILFANPLFHVRLRLFRMLFTSKSYSIVDTF